MKKSDLILVIVLSIISFAVCFYVMNQYAEAGRLCVNRIDNTVIVRDAAGNIVDIEGGVQTTKSYPKILFASTIGTCFISAELLRFLAIVNEVEKRNEEAKKANEAQTNEEQVIEKPATRMSDDEDEIPDGIVSYLFSGMTKAADEQ